MTRSEAGRDGVLQRPGIRFRFQLRPGDRPFTASAWWASSAASSWWSSGSSWDRQGI